MLPGFRFLVAAIVFSLSVLVFGLGAAALFRAAHEQFASSSSWRMTPEGSYTSFLPPAEPPRPVIAMLRVEPTAASAPAPLSVPQADLQPTENPAASAEASDAMSAIVAAPAADAAPAQETTMAAAPPLPAAETTIVAVAAPTATSPDVDDAQATKPETTAVPPAAPATAADIVATDPPKLDAPPPMPAISPSPVAAGPVVARQDVLPTFAEAQIPNSTAIVTSDASNATPLPVPAPSRSELLAQMIALSADRATTNDHTATEHKASIKTASLHLRQSLAKKRQAKERAAKERLAEARRAKRQREMAQRAHAARQAAAAQQQRQFADPFAQPQGFGGQQAFGQQAAQPR